MSSASAPADRPRPKASVIVVNLNGLRYLDTCFEALLDQDLEGGFEALLVDNGSSDQSVDHVRSRWPQVRIHESRTNLGFAGGNNLGIREARGENVVLLNNDTRVRPGWLQALVTTAEAAPDAGAVTSKLVYKERPNVIQNAGSLLLSDGSGADRGSGEDDSGQFDRQEEVFAACGCAVLFKRRMLDEVGAFDESFFCYYEDTDLSWRMRLRGWRVMYEPRAVVEHVHSGTSSEWSPFFTFHVDRNRLFMILKNAPAGFVLRAFAGLGARAVGRACLLLVALVAPSLVRREGTGWAGEQQPARRGASRAGIQVKVLGSLVRHLPEMIGKRRRVRGARKVADAEVLRLLYPRSAWDARAAG
jgi:GT2 family glycosyltransferase